jgi:cytosine/adenosine deaminase-related metal-dependent hydrolase
MTSILLQAGTVLTHQGDRVKVLRDHDVLIGGNKIKAIGRGLTLPDGTTDRVIDCRGKIISPGFIDTHRHLWQSQVPIPPPSYSPPIFYCSLTNSSL